VIGLILPTAGRAVWVSEACREGIEAALALAREDGDRWADRVRLVPAAATDPDAARAEARRLIASEGARVLIGSALSEYCLAASEAAEALGALYWEVASVADEVTERGFRTMFRLNANARSFAAASVALVVDVLPAIVGSVERLAVAYERTALGTTVGRAVAAIAKARGLAVVAEEPFRTTGSDPSDLPALVARIGAAGPQALLATAVGTDAATIVREVARQRIPLKALVGAAGGWGGLPLRRELGALLDGVFSVNNARAWRLAPDGLTPAARVELERYRASCAARRLIEPLADRDLAFVGMRLLVGSVAPAAGSLALDDLRRAALALDVPDGGTVIGMGVRFDASGHNTRGRPVAMQWQAGTLMTVDPVELATHPIMEPSRTPADRAT